MGNFELWLVLLGKGLLSLLTQPVFYASFLLLFFIYIYRIRLERAMFSVKLQTWVKPFLISLIGGVTISVSTSLISVLLGFTFTTATVWWIWGVSLLLMLIRLRFVSVVYSAGIVTLLHLIAKLIGPLPLKEDVLAVYESLLSLEAVNIVIVASLMSVGQSLLVKWQGKHFVSPIYLSGKRGKIIGGYVLQSYWAAPVLLFMPVTPNAAGAVSFTANTMQPFFLTVGPEAWLLLACPLLLGVTGITYSSSPAQFVTRIFKQRLLASCGLLLVSLGAFWYKPLIWVAALGLLLCFELIHLLNYWNESKQSPKYGPLDQGLRVLAIVEHSPAVHMGIQPGDTVVKANGVAVNSLDELYEAMSTNPAFCKLELLNQDGEIKFAQRARFADEHHQLGIIMAPDKHAKYWEHYREPSLLSLFGVGKLRHQSSLKSRDMTTAL